MSIVADDGKSGSPYCERILSAIHFLADGLTYPAGAHVHIAIINAGRNAEFFERPNEFRPERFDAPPTYTGPGKDFAFVPFSAGSRNCIGQKFAELELKSVLSKTLRRFEVSLHPDSVPEPKLIATLILNPARPLLFHFKQRSTFV